MWFQASERAHLAHIMVVWCFPQDHATQCNNKSNDCKATQSRPLNKMPKCKTRIRSKRLANVKAKDVYHSDRRWHLFANKKTPCQPNLCGSKCPPEILVVWYVFITQLLRAKCCCFCDESDEWLRHKNTSGRLPPCQPSLVKESLSDLGGTVFITRPLSTNLAMFIARTCSQRLSKKINKRTIAGTVTKKRHLEGCHYFNHHPFMGTTHRPSWYAEHHETTQCNYIADEFTLSASLD